MYRCNLTCAGPWRIILVASSCIPVRYTENLYEDVTYRISANELRVAMGSDVVVTGASVSDDYRIVKEADGTWLNEYQMRMRQGAIYVEVVDYPLARARDQRRY